MLSILQNTTLGEIKLYIEDAKQKAPHLATRIDKALYLILMREFRVTSDSTVEIESEAKPGTFYTITEGKTCTCADFTRHQAPNGYCKHRLSYYIIAQLEKRTQER